MQLQQTNQRPNECAILAIQSGLLKFLWFGIITLSIVYSSRTAYAQDNAVVTVRYQDLEKILAERNQAVQGAKLNIESAKLQTGHLRRSFLPATDLHAGVEHFKTGPYDPTTQATGGLDVSVNLYRGGKDSLEEKIRQSGAAVASAQAKGIIRGELLKAQEYYWELAHQQELVDIYEDALRLNETGRAAAQNRFRRGLVTQTDVLEFEIHRDQLKESLETARHEVELIQIGLAAALGFPETTQIRATDKIIHEHDESLIRRKFTARESPEVAALLENQSSVQLQSQMAKRWWTPDIELYGTYSLYTLRERFYPELKDRIDIAGGVRLHIPLLASLTASSEAKSISVRAIALEKQTDQRTRELNAQIQRIQGEMIHLHELLHVSESRIDQGKRYLKQTQDEYNRGVKNSPDLLLAIERLASFKHQYAGRRKEYQDSKIKLLALTQPSTIE